MRIGSLFSGAGMLDHGVQTVLGGTVAWHCENNPAAAKVLAHHYPDVPNLHDITTVDFSTIGHTPMPAPRCDEHAQEMYDLYCQGLSLAQVGEHFGVSRQTVYQMFKRRGLDLRQRLAPLPYQVFNGERYTVGDHGYYRKTRGDRSLMHRDVWRHNNGEIPDGWDIHHRDHDKTNNVISNLECLPKADHARLYNLGCNGFSHKCGLEVVPTGQPVVDVLTAGWPRAMPAVLSRRQEERRHR